MVCTRKTKTLVSTCVILSGMTNIICLLYVGWVTNYIASVYVRGQEPAPDKKLEEDKGDTLKIIERLDHLENVIKQHIQGTGAPRNLGRPVRPGSAQRSAGCVGAGSQLRSDFWAEAADARGAACTLSPECGTLVSAAVRASPGHTCVLLAGSVGARCTRVQMCVWLRAGGSQALGIPYRSDFGVCTCACLCVQENAPRLSSSFGYCTGPR